MNKVEQQEAHSLKGYLLAGLAVMTCPCHLVIFIPLLSGTAAGALLSEHILITSGLFLGVFVLSAAGAFRFLAQTPESRVNEPENQNNADLTSSRKECTRCLD